MTRAFYDVVIIGTESAAGSAPWRRTAVSVPWIAANGSFAIVCAGKACAWGKPAKALGIYEPFAHTLRIEVRWWDIYLGRSGSHGATSRHTPHGSPLFSFYHPAMQDVLLIPQPRRRRGAARPRATQLRRRPVVTVDQAGWMREIGARLVVGADGRNHRPASGPLRCAP